MSLLIQLSDLLMSRRVDLVSDGREYVQALVPTFWGGLQVNRQSWQREAEFLLAVIDLTGGVPEELRGIVGARSAAA